MGFGCWRGVANLPESQPSNAEVVKVENPLLVKAPPVLWRVIAPPPGFPAREAGPLRMPPDGPPPKAPPGFVPP